MAGEAFDLWVPYMMQPQLYGVEEWMLRDRQDRNLLGIARLKPGVTLEQARGEMEELAALMAVVDADTNEGISATLLPLSKSHFGPQGLLAAPLKILMGVCVAVLLIVCANVANLLLARTASRQKEFSTRLALGAGRGRLARQVLTESLLLAAAGGTGWSYRNELDEQGAEALLPPGQMSLATRFRLKRRRAALHDCAVRADGAARRDWFRRCSQDTPAQRETQRRRPQRHDGRAHASPALAAGCV